MNPKVDWFFEKADNWQAEFAQLRHLILDCGLTEELKWGCPCYTFQKANVVLIHGFKEYCAILFMKGALLNNEHGLLIQQTENVQAARQIRFTNLAEITALEPVLKTTIFEAIEVEKAGLKVELKKTTAFNLPEELQLIFNENVDFKTAFEALSAGRQRGYLLHFSQPKQSQTRVSRIEKAMPQIFDGKGLNDM
jgi:uncharacterized protein YdeI (YjbR/CyaY-like superfamily)